MRTEQTGAGLRLRILVAIGALTPSAASCRHRCALPSERAIPPRSRRRWPVVARLPTQGAGKRLEEVSDASTVDAEEGAEMTYHPATRHGAGYDTPDVLQSRGPRRLVLITSLAYLAAAIAGASVASRLGLVHAHGHAQRHALMSQINPAHNTAHLAAGLVGLALAWNAVTARLYGWLLFLVYAPAFVYGIATSGRPHHDVLSLTRADNLIHALTAFIGFVVARWPVGRLPGGYPPGPAGDR